MRYSASHKQETRERLLQSSAVSAKKEGFSTVGVDGLMKAIGLSGGAFYSHFSSKDELFGSIVERELSQSLERLGADGEQSRMRLERCLKHYLNMAHLESPETGCALPTLGAEISRADEGFDSRQRSGFSACSRVGRVPWAAIAWPGRFCRNVWGHWWWRECWSVRTFSARS